MSMAIAHFAVGVSFGVLFLITTGLYKTDIDSVVLFVFGGWAMIPDLAKAVPNSYISVMFSRFHDTVFANLFFLHRVIDVYDARDTTEFASLCLFLMFGLLSLMWINKLHQN